MNYADAAAGTPTCAVNCTDAARRDVATGRLFLVTRSSGSEVLAFYLEDRSSMYGARVAT